MNEQLENLALQIKQGEIVPFIGAGVSLAFPSNIPAAYQFKKTLLSPLVAATNENTDITELVNTGLESIMQTFLLYRQEEVFESIIDSIKNVSAYNPMHLLASLVAGISNLCITTNFDLLIEKSGEQNGINFEKISSRNDFKKGRQENFNIPTILKLHGCSSDVSSIALTIDDVAKGFSDKNLEKILSDICANHHLLILGYSGCDRDLMPIIIKYSKILTWVIHSGNQSTGRPSVDDVKKLLPEESLALKLIGDSRCNFIIGNTSEISEKLFNLVGFNYSSHVATAFDGSAIHNSINKIPQGAKLLILAQLYFSLGHYDKAIELFENNTEARDQNFDSSLLYAKALANTNNIQLIQKARSYLGALDFSSNSDSKKIIWKCIKNNILGYISDYENNLEQSEKYRNEGLELIDIYLNNKKISQVSRDILKQKSDLLLNLANVKFWEGKKPNDIYDPLKMRESNRISYESLRIAEEIGDYVNIAKLHENIAHIEFKRAFFEGENIALAHEGVIKMRKRAIEMFDFLNDARGKYHSYKNWTDELIIMGRINEALENIKILFSISLYSGFTMASVVSEEMIGDIATKSKKKNLALYHYKNALKGYDLMEISANSYRENVAHKIEKINS